MAVLMTIATKGLDQGTGDTCTAPSEFTGPGTNNSDVAAGQGVLVFTLNISQVATDDSPVATSSLVDSAGNTYVKQTAMTLECGPAVPDGAAQSFLMEVWYCDAAASALTGSWTMTATWDGDTNQRILWAYSLSGHLASPFVNVKKYGEHDETVKAALEIFADDSPTWTFTGDGGIVVAIVPEVKFGYLDDPPVINSGGFQNAAFVDDAGPDWNYIIPILVDPLAGISGSGAVVLGANPVGTTGVLAPGQEWYSTFEPPWTVHTDMGTLYKSMLVFGLDAATDVPPAIASISHTFGLA